MCKQGYITGAFQNIRKSNATHDSVDGRCRPTRYFDYRSMDENQGSVNTHCHRILKMQFFGFGVGSYRRALGSGTSTSSTECVKTRGDEPCPKMPTSPKGPRATIGMRGGVLASRVSRTFRVFTRHQYLSDIPGSGPDVQLGPVSRHSLVTYIRGH